MTISLVAVNIAVFFHELSLTPDELQAFFHAYGVVPRNIGGPAEALNLFLTGQWQALTPLVTATFVHGGWLHLIGNLWYLWIFADNIEDRLGRGRFLVFFFFVAVLGNYSQVLTDPTSAVPMVGASGAVAGVLGAYLVLFPGSRVLALVPIGFFVTLAEVPALLFLFLWFLLQLLSGVASIGAGALGGVAWWAHIGGFLIGMLSVPFLNRQRRLA